MLYVVNKMALAHVNVFLIIMAIHMKVAGQSVLLTPIVRQTEAVYEINVSIHALEFVHKMPNAEL